MKTFGLDVQVLFIKILFTQQSRRRLGGGVAFIVCLVLKPRIPMVVNFSHEWLTFFGRGDLYI